MGVYVDCYKYRLGSLYIAPFLTPDLPPALVCQRQKALNAVILHRPGNSGVLGMGI
jgi:hypothetical protein